MAAAQGPRDDAIGAALRLLSAAPAMLLSVLDGMLRPAGAARGLSNVIVDGATGGHPGAAASPAAPPRATKAEGADAAQAAMVRDTLNGLIAFVVPGPDPYSVAQGVSTTEPGGVAADILPLLIDTLNRTQPSLAGGPPAAAFVAGALNEMAARVNPSANERFASQFAALSFAEKTRVIEVIEANAQTRPLAGVLPLIAFLVYSEAAVHDRRGRVLRGIPLGWRLSGYEGVADGRAEFAGYLDGRTAVKTSAALAWR